jgi:GDP-D-mannose dehydratase
MRLMASCLITSLHREVKLLNKKITKTTAKIALGMDNCLYLGNSYAKRYWGHAKDYIEGMYLILQQENVRILF